MDETFPLEDRKQALRKKRVRIAALSYLLGFCALALCSALDLLEPVYLAVIGSAFAVVNAVILTVFARGWNLRFAEPSLTNLQIYTGVAMVALIVALAGRVQFLAVPFYGSVFVFAMLKLTRRELLRLELAVLLSYGGAVLARSRLLGQALEPRMQAIDFALVVLGSLWYMFAAVYISELRARLRASKRTIEELALRDGLTGTWNRRQIDALLAAELLRKARIGGRLCACLVDVDHFKAINDRHGHAVGDEALRRVAGGIGAQLRAVDQLGRYGGEEFLVLLPGVSLEEARLCAERLRTAIAALPSPAGDGRAVTISLGVAESAAGETPAQLLARADRALYRAKHLGRDRVEVEHAAVVQAA